MYLNIKKQCNIIYGINGACIYDLEINKLYNVEIEEAKILKDIESGKNLTFLKTKYDNKVLFAFLDKLQKANCATISTIYKPNEIYRKGRYKISRLEKTYIINTCYLELPFSCEINCDYCNDNRLFGCYSCYKVSDKNIPIDYYFYKDTINLLKKYGCKLFILYGGDLISNFELLKEILFFLNKDVKIVLLLSIQNNISQEINEFLDQLNIIQVLNVDVKKIKEYNFFNKPNIVYNINIPLTDYSKFIEKTNEYKNNFIVSFYGEPKEDINYFTVFPHRNLTLENFRILQDINPCLFGKIAIKSNKKIYPCIGSQNSLGDLSTVNEDSFMKCFNELITHWESSVNNKTNCSECKFRYSCTDCRSYEIKLREKFKENFCNEIEVKYDK